MARLKREMKKNGFSFEDDYECMPYDDGRMVLDSITMKVVDGMIHYTRYYTSVICTYIIDRSFNIVDVVYN